MCKHIFFSAQLLAKVPGHRPRYFNRYNDILDIRQHVDLISVQNPGWLTKKYRVKNYPNLSNMNCELSESSMGFPFGKKKQSFGLKNTLTVETCCWIFQDKFMKRYVHNCSHPLNLTAYAEAWLRNFHLDVGQNGRPRGPQMWMSSLVLTIHNFGVPNFDPYPPVFLRSFPSFQVAKLCEIRPRRMWTFRRWIYDVLRLPT